MNATMNLSCRATSLRALTPTTQETRAHSVERSMETASSCSSTRRPAASSCMLSAPVSEDRGTIDAIYQCDSADQARVMHASTLLKR